MQTITLNITLTDDHVADIVSAITGEPKMAAPKAPTTAPATAIMPESSVDNFGVPWHPEHHSSVKKITTKGIWKRIRGGDKTACELYEDQFLKKEDFTPLPHIAKDHPTPVPAPAPVEAEVEAPVEAPVEAEAPTMPMPTAEPVVKPVSYEMMVASFQELQTSKGEQAAVTIITDLYAEHGVENPEQVQTDETVRAAIDAGLRAAI